MSPFAYCTTQPRRFKALPVCFVLALCILGSATVASAATLCVNPTGDHGCLSSISAAVSAAKAGDVIRVQEGTYKEQVTITKALSLVASGREEVSMDAKGLPNGIFINGMGAAPAIGVSNVLIKGFQIRNANFEGILIAPWLYHPFESGHDEDW